MPFGFQSFDDSGWKAFGLQDAGAVEGAEVGQVDGFLRVHSPVQRAVKRFRGEMDDERAAWAAGAHDDLTCGFVNHEGGRHAGAGAFAGLDAVGDGFA